MFGGIRMCKQKKVLDKIKKAKKVNGYGVDLAVAQMEDYLDMQKRITNIEKDVSDIKTEQVAQGAKLDLIIEHLNSPVEQERKNGIIWQEIKKGLSGTKFWLFLLMIVACVALAGDKILELLRILPVGA